MALEPTRRGARPAADLVVPSTAPDGRPRPLRPSRSIDADAVHADDVRRVAERLAAAGVPSPQADARWLVAHAVETFGEVDDRARVARLAELVARREQREPLQLILGTTAFRTVELACRPGVFVPRPETEVVAGEAIAAARAAGPAPVVAEPCTGTGAIACSLVAEVPGVRVVATDLSALAVALARENLARVAAGVTAKRPGDRPSWEVHRGELLAPVDAALRGHLDVLVANPPYLPAADRGAWDPEVADHDPHVALVGGPDGHEVVDALVATARSWLAPAGTLVLEIDARRAQEALGSARRAGLVEVRAVLDLTGAPRVLVARRGG
jgi:release factor glutamine methyltransferase